MGRIVIPGGGGGGGGTDLLENIWTGADARDWGMTSAYGSTSFMNGSGFYATVATTDASSSRGDDASGAFLQQNTTTTAGGDAYVGNGSSDSGVTGEMHLRTMSPVYSGKFALMHPAQVRALVGFVELGGGTMLGTDDPNGSQACIQVKDGGSVWTFRVQANNAPSEEEPSTVSVSTATPM